MLACLAEAGSPYRSAWFLMKSYSAAYKYGVMLHLYGSSDFSTVAYCGQRGQKIAFLHCVALGFWSLHRQIDYAAAGCAFGEQKRRAEKPNFSSWLINVMTGSFSTFCYGLSLQISRTSGLERETSEEIFLDIKGSGCWLNKWHISFYTAIYPRG